MQNAGKAQTTWASDVGALRFLNRELSWLDFDHRVLELAADPRVPLLERVKLCSIVSSNLDEFFAVRVARLQRQLYRGRSDRSPDGRTATETLADARQLILAIQERQDELWQADLRPALAAERIRIASVEECNPRELEILRRRFDRDITPLLSPIAVGASARFPTVPSLALNIALIALDKQTGERRFVRLNVPTDVPRFLEVAAGATLVSLEEAILYFLPAFLAPATVETAAVFRITRDAEFSLAAHPDDVLEAVESELRRRRFGNVVRLEIGRDASPEIVEFLRQELTLERSQIYESDAPLGLQALSELADIERPKLKYSRWVPQDSRTFGKRAPAATLAQIRRGDLLVHHPYDSFETSVQAFVDCARDPRVATLKGTVYRTGEVSPTLSSLVKTAEEEKQALAVVELQARFDEHRNIEWARSLERAGVNVVYGLPPMKVHAKLALVVCREASGLRRYAHIGTGNYHVSNASTYEDLSLFTADEEIAADVADVFNAITGGLQPRPFRKLLVGPWFLRAGILREIDRTVAAAGAGQLARIRIKCNSLVDPEIIEALYAASAAGVRIEIVVRGLCALRPRVPGMSERIAVHSVLGRFLEHSRIFTFTTGNETTMWIGSADLMPRNLDRRIEVLAPIEDHRLQAEIDAIFAALLSDTQSSWTLQPDGTWRRRCHESASELSAQELLMARACETTAAPHRPEGDNATTRRAA
jgi:polyphosphate kinase